MERVVIVGNCQAKALEMLLHTNPAFAERFEFVSLPPVHELPAADVPALHRAVAQADVLIAQKIDAAYRDGLGLGTETLAEISRAHTIIRWPSVYWAGYVPDLFYLRDPAGQLVLDGPFDYHDRAILTAYASGLDACATCRLLEDEERPSNAPAWAAAATAELEIRGQDCDVEVASFIESRFRDELLFFTMNHPSNRVLGHLAGQITETLGLPGRVDPRLMPDEPLGSTFYPLHANHVRALELRFGESVTCGRARFKIRGVSHDPAQAMRSFFDYYCANPELVGANLTPG
jgi:Polysaccharide biosynthesis enzyme WcbI